jgi:hypothetical protein
MRFYNQFLSVLLSCLVILACHFDRDTLHVFTGVVVWLWWWLEIPRRYEECVLADGAPETTRYPVAKDLEHCRFITINELMQVPGPCVAEVKVLVP